MQDINYEALLKSTSDWIWAVDKNGVYTYCSENVYDYLGFSAHEVVGKTPFDFMKEDEAARVADIFSKLVKDRAPLEALENTHIHRFGVEVIVETTGIAIFDEKGNFDGYQGFDKDITAIKKMQEQLKSYTKEMEQQKNYLNKSQKIAHVGVWEFNIKEDTLTWSDETYNIFGRRRETFKPSYENFIQCVHSDDVDRLNEEFNNSIREKRPYFCAHRIVREDAEIRYVEERGEHTYDENNEIIATIGVVLDTTDIYQKKEELDAIKERMDAALLGSNIGVWEWNLLDDTLYLSEQWKALLGYSDTELDNRLSTWKAKVHPDDIDELFSSIRKSIEYKTQYIENTHRLKHRNGAWIWCLARAQIEYNDKGNALRILGTHSDISKEKAVKQELAELNTTLESRVEIAIKQANSTLERFGDNVISSNSDIHGVITYASQALCRISGYTLEELVGQPHSILRHPDMPKRIFKELWKTIKSGKEWTGEIKNLTKDGNFYWVRTSIIPEFSDDGEISGYTSIRHEITSQKAKESFLANMSHELRTPLNSIIGFSNILNKKLQKESNQELAQQVNSSAHGLLNLINDILDLSKIQDSTFNIEPYAFNAYNEIVQASNNFKAIATEKDLQFNIHIDEVLKGSFLGDWHRISQIILNLISNAIKFTPKEGVINFECSYQNQSMIIMVKDSGIGMNKSVQDKIFKPFEQADGSTTRKYGGTGLGLSITQTLVELMKGSIELESQEQKGTNFTVTLPLKILKDVHKTLENSDTDEHEQIALNTHILIAEDNKTNQMLLKMLLEEFEITCDVANDGVEALQIYDPKKHALILMDENMPNMSGVESMKAIKEKFNNHHTPIIALTANAMKGDRERFLALGMNDYLSKPIDEKALYSTLKKHLSF